MRCPQCGTKLVMGLGGGTGTYSCPNLCVSGVRPPAAEPIAAAPAPAPRVIVGEIGTEQAGRPTVTHDVRIAEAGDMQGGMAKPKPAAVAGPTLLKPAETLKPTERPSPDQGSAAMRDEAAQAGGKPAADKK